MSLLCPDCRAILPDAVLHKHFDKLCPARGIECPVCLDLVQAQHFTRHVLDRHRQCDRWTYALSSDRSSLGGCLGYTPWSEGFVLVRDLVVTETAEAFEVKLQLTAYALGECSEQNPATARVTFEAQIKSLDREASASCEVSFKPWVSFTVSFPIRAAPGDEIQPEGPRHFSLGIRIV
jgi:hypothetical protein